MKYFLLFFVALVFLAGCRKEDEQPANKLWGSWQKIKIESNDAAGNWNEVKLACMTADIEQYRSDGEVTIFVGDSPCGPGTDVYRGTWRQEADGTKIIYDFHNNTGEFEATIDELTDDRLILIRNVSSGGPQFHRTTYIRK